MTSRKIICNLTCLALAVTPLSSMAATALPLDGSTFNLLLKTHPIIQPGVKNKENVNGNALIVRNSRLDKNNIHHYRVKQFYRGVPVFGIEGVIHSKDNISSLMGAVTRKGQSNITGQLYDDLDKDIGNPEQSYFENDVNALADFKKAYKNFDMVSDGVEHVVYIDEQKEAHWAYKVQVTINRKNDIPKRPTAIVDAETFEPFVEWDDIKTISKVKGYGFGGNHKVLKHQYGIDKPPLNITRDDQLNECFLDNEFVKVVDMKHKQTSPNHPVKFSCAFSDPADDLAFWTGYASDGYDMVNGAYSPANDALYAGEVIHGLYKDWFGLDALTNQDKPMKIVMRVHYGQSYENAFWDGEQMTFGDGADTFHPLVSLGIGAHEISHGFTQQHSDLMYFGQSGGMNEAFSDMAAQAAEYYSNQENNWLIGSSITKTSSTLEALRYMDVPSKDGLSIDSADQYQRGLDVHYSSGVYNRLFYILANMPNWDTKKAFHVMVKANMDYWTPYSTFETGACGVLDSTRDLGYSEPDVLSAFEQVHIDTSQCKNHSFKS